MYAFYNIKKSMRETMTPFKFYISLTVFFIFAFNQTGLCSLNAVDPASSTNTPTVSAMASPVEIFQSEAKIPAYASGVLSTANTITGTASYSVRMDKDGQAWLTSPSDGELQATITSLSDTEMKVIAQIDLPQVKANYTAHLKKNDTGSFEISTIETVSSLIVGGVETQKISGTWLFENGWACW